MTTPDLRSDFGAIAGRAPASRAGARRFLLWDLPLRVFHWSLVAAVTTAVVTGELGGAWMPWHGRAGLAIVGLLVFRIVWGFIGSNTARFARFLGSPLAALRHLAHLRRREPDREIGHNAAGGWMVLVMLALIGVQAATDKGTCGPNPAYKEPPSR